MFLRYFALKLDRDRPCWRSNSLLTMDGAACKCLAVSLILLFHIDHTADSTKDLIKKLRLPVSVLGPYGYQAAPAEIFFAAFKTGDLNPMKIATTKGNFDALVQLVVKKIQAIPRHRLILHHHHCLMAAYRYLWHTPL